MPPCALPSPLKPEGPNYNAAPFWSSDRIFTHTSASKFLPPCTGSKPQTSSPLIDTRGHLRRTPPRNRIERPRLLAVIELLRTPVLDSVVIVHLWLLVAPHVVHVLKLCGPEIRPSDKPLGAFDPGHRFFQCRRDHPVRDPARQLQVPQDWILVDNRLLGARQKDHRLAYRTRVHWKCWDR
eukprot:232369-Rhodomonas_salina.1